MTTGHQLAQLIDSIKEANGWSDTDLVRNAEAKGHVLSKSNISRYRNPVVSIKGDIIRALAAGLRITPAQVAIAALESMGVPLPRYDVPTAEQAVRLDTGLSDRDRESVLALLKALRAHAVSVSSPSASVRAQADAHAKSGSTASAESAPVIELPVRDDTAAPVAGGQAAAARTEPGYRKGQAEQGEAGGDENQSAGAPAEEDVNQDQDG